MGVIAEGIPRGCQGLFTPVSLGYPLSVFNKNSTLKDRTSFPQKSPSRVHMRTMMALRLFAENGPFGSCARLMAYFEREKGQSCSKKGSSFRMGSFADNDGPFCRRWPSWVLRLAPI